MGCLSNGSHMSDLNMSCQDDSDCSYGFSCRSIISGGTECRAKENIQQPSNEQANPYEPAAYTSVGSTVQSKIPEIEPTTFSNSELNSSADIKPSLANKYSEVELTKKGGVYLIPAEINEVLKIKFIIDSGAADVSISPDVFFTLVKTDTIYERDWLPGQKYQLADGSVAESNRFLIRTLQIGNRVLKNVTCSISNSIEAPMLLGQSALEQLGNFTFDYDAGVVRFQNNAGTYEDAMEAYLKGDFAQAVNLWRSLAENGDLASQDSLGSMYFQGLGVPKDYREAYKWYRLGAEQGWAKAQFNLGSMYFDGLGVPQDYREAFKWYHLSAGQGFSLAQITLGLMYNIGQGVPQDYIRAYVWYYLAANQGIKEAQNNREILAQQMTSAQIDEAQKIARECITKNYKNCD